MAKGMNKVFLLGNLGRAPEVRTANNGSIVATFSLATPERFKDQGGNWQDRTEWHNCVAFGRTAEIIRDYVGKGSKLFVEGKMQTRSWEDKDSGQKKYKTEVFISDVTLLGAPMGKQAFTPTADDEEQPGYAYTRQVQDDDVPF
ncbi:single-stranded DNA-binding protein [Edaphobacter albus]|uniref:single-stranded DNA-binding protein n=1 Tax=Edaphobacter sp. 4G125 TaxID=2763071 RepID=UPI00164762D3|nr:single-stranded DNA-binding protein [Edaphobacter sp. 4G125]QNI37521.1 single-stranded DNA-binding protein [Edaphobacter sp. 4G125]